MFWNLKMHIRCNRKCYVPGCAHTNEQVPKTVMQPERMRMPQCNQPLICSKATVCAARLS